MNWLVRSLCYLVITSAAWLAVACSDVAVEAIATTDVYRESIPEFPAIAGPQDLVQVLMRRSDFERHIGEEGSLGLYASDCRSFDPGILLGSRIGAGRLDSGRDGYWLRFVLLPSHANEHYSRDWSRVECVYMRSQPDYSPTNYRSNFVPLNDGGKSSERG
jgi:hypothetical protein